MEYRCICGEEFNSSQKFNGHRSRCKLYYLNKYGNLDRFNTNNLKRLEQSLVGTKEYNRRCQIDKQKKWILERHLCEKCGIVMDRKYGSGRFCSRKCANSRNHSIETRIKISESLSGNILSEEEKLNLLNRKPKTKFIYKGPDLPEIPTVSHNRGYFPRNICSIPEMFWMSVLDLNNISYMHDYIIHKPKGERGVYRIDFLIDNYDIEIDGATHNNISIKDKDNRRDNYLKSIGYIVYRIKWIKPNTDKKRYLVNKQIDDLFNFIRRCRLV